MCRRKQLGHCARGTMPWRCGLAMTPAPSLDEEALGNVIAVSEPVWTRSQGRHCSQPKVVGTCTYTCTSVPSAWPRLYFLATPCIRLQDNNLTISFRRNPTETRSSQQKSFLPRSAACDARMNHSCRVLPPRITSLHISLPSLH